MGVYEPDDAEDFDRIIEENEGTLVVIDFYATWCGPCKIMGPKFAKMSAEKDFKEVVFMKVDVDENEDIASRFEIKVMPTFVFIKDGTQIDAVEGSMDEELRSKLTKHK